MSEIKYVIEVDDSQVEKTFSDIEKGTLEVAKTTEKANASQQSIIESLGKSYRDSIGDAVNAYKQLTPELQAINTQLSKYLSENDRLATAQAEINRLMKEGAMSQQAYLDATKESNKRIKELETAMAKLREQVKKKNDEDKAQIGSIAEMTARLTQLKQRYDQLTEAQRKNANVGGVIAKEYQKVSKEVERASEAMQGSSKGVAGLLGSLGKVAGALGIAFSAQQVVQFGLEIFDLAKKIDGVSLAFAQIGSGTEGLEKLRTATRNTVDDLKLMQLAVDANNFKIPMDTLAKGLEFADRRAQATGKSVDYLVESFVTGMGRKSTMILDNLGLSIIEIQDEVKKVGDFNIAVANIIEREMSRSGEAVDTLSTKTGRLMTLWQNFKVGLAKWTANLFGDIDVDNVDKLIQKAKAGIGEFDKASDKSRKASIANTEFQIKAIENQLKASQELRKEMTKPGYVRKGDETLEKQLRIEKSLREEKLAQQAILADITKQNNALETKERISKGIVSDAELEAQIAEKRQLANTWVVKDNSDLAKKNQLLKEADALQKKLDSRSGEAGNDAAKKAQQQAEQYARQLEQDQDKRLTLLQKWADTDTGFLDKQLSRDEEEVKSVRNKYASLLLEIEKYNKESKAKKIDTGGLKESEEKSLIAVRNKQAFALEQERLDKELAIWTEYEQLKTKIGEEKAKERFASELNFAVTYQQQIEKAIADLESKPRTGQEDDQLKVFKARLKAFTDAKRKQDNADYAEALEASKNFNDKRLDIDRDYEKKKAALGVGATEEQLKQLDKVYAKAISALATSELTDSDVWTKLFSNLDEVTARELQTMIDIIERDFDKLKGSFDPIDLEAIRKKLEEAKNVVIKDNPFAQMSKAIKGIFANAGDESKEGAAEILKNWRNLSKSTEKAFEFVNDAVNSADFLKDALGEVGATALATLTSVATVAIATSAAIKGAEKASVILAIIGAALVVIQAIVGLFKSIFAANDKRLEKSIQDKKQAVEELDRAFQNLERSISNSIGESFYTDSKKQIDNLRQQQKIIEEMIKDEESKKKSDKNKLQGYKDDINGINNQILDVQKNITENLVQTSFKALSDNIARALTSAFEAGEDGIKALNKTFDSFIKDAVVNSLKLKLIEPIIAEMIDTVSKYMQTNKNSLAGFDFTEWREKLGNVGVLFTDSLKDLYAGLGLEADSKEATGLSGALRREMTEATASELTGLYRSTYDLQKRSFDFSMVWGNKHMMFMNDSLRIWGSINTNTANTVSRLDGAVTQLEIIANNTGGLNERFV